MLVFSPVGYVFMYIDFLSHSLKQNYMLDVYEFCEHLLWQTTLSCISATAMSLLYNEQPISERKVESITVSQLSIVVSALYSLL